jgi:hypothetical protein
MDEGDRMLLWCTGGPSVARAVVFPPPLEIEVGSGLYVLIDVGPPEQWHYEFVTDDRHR